MKRPTSSPVYQDCNATTPTERAVQEVVLLHMVEEFGNAGSRTHEFGLRAKRAVQEARDQVASLVAAQRDEVVFTSGATESNNLALLGLEQEGVRTGRRHILSSPLEHKAVLEPLEELAKRGFEVELLPVDGRGWVAPESLVEKLRPDTFLVSLMHVNNETGVRQPLDAYAAVLASHAAYWHVDAAQGFGKDVPGLRSPRIDLISISGHKVYAPKGIGALIARRRGFDALPLRPLLFGGGQERGLRPGTLPVALIAGLGKAAALAERDHKARSAICAKKRSELLAALLPLEPEFNGDQDACLHHVVNMSFPGVDSEALMVTLKPYIAISNGSACTSHEYKPSHVLRAMGLSDDRIRGAIRISWCHMTEDIDWETVADAIGRLR